MKPVLLMLTGIIVCTTCFSQSRRENNYIIWPVDEKTEKIIFSESVHVPDANPDSMLLAAAQYLTRTFNSSKDTIVVDNKTKTITCIGSFATPVAQLNERGIGYVRFDLVVHCQQYSYSYQLTNLHHYPLYANGVYGGALENEKAACGGMLFPLPYWNDVQATTWYKVQTTLEQLKEAMYKNEE